MDLFLVEVEFSLEFVFGLPPLRVYT